MTTRAIRLYACAGLTIALALLAAPASAQYRPRPLNDPATGELYHIEASASWWRPSSDISITSAGSGALEGVAGTTIDAKSDLGFQDKSLPALSLVLRPAQRHKLRMQYIPIKYTGSTILRRTIVFNGQAYAGNLPVESTLDWKAYRFNYEFDFITKNRGFGGFIIEAKYTDIRADLRSPVATEFAHARFPVPALGGIARFYVVPNISITGEVTGFKIPDSIDDRYKAHYVDVDIYGTVNLTNNFGVHAGYRALDLGYLIKKDTGSFTLKGLYFGGVARY
jgi:hypothetical protein